MAVVAALEVGLALGQCGRKRGWESSRVRACGGRLLLTAERAGRLVAIPVRFRGEHGVGGRSLEHAERRCVYPLARKRFKEGANLFGSAGLHASGLGHGPEDPSGLDVDSAGNELPPPELA